MDLNWMSVWDVMRFPVLILGSMSVVVVLYLVVYLAAKKDFILGFVPQGQIKAVMKGDSLHKMLVNIGGYRYDETTREIVLLTPEERGSGRWRNPMGLYIIGWPLYHQVKKYKFSWVKWGKPEGSSEFALIPRDEEMVNSLYFRYPYGVNVTGIKVRGNIEVIIELVVTIEVVRPETTLFRLQPTGNWLGIVLAKVGEATRGYAGEQDVDIEKLRQLKARDESMSDHLNAQIMKMNGDPLMIAQDLATRSPIYGEEAPDGILHLCGVRIISVEFKNWRFSDGQVAKDFQLEEVNLRKAAGRRAEADGEAYFILEVGNAEAEVLSNKVDAAGEEVLQAELIANGMSNFNGQVLTWGTGASGPMTNYQVGQLPATGSAPSRSPARGKPRGYKRPAKNPVTPPPPPTPPPTSPPTAPI